MNNIANILKTEEEIDYMEGLVKENEKKIQKLETAKKSVKEVKEELRNNKIDINCDEWKGINANNYRDFIDNTIDEFNEYYSLVDDVEDSINDEITRLQNEIYNNEPIIGKLKVLLNSLKNEVENIFN